MEEMEDPTLLAVAERELTRPRRRPAAMRRTPIAAGLAATLTVLVVLAACTPYGGGPPGPETADDAARLVLAADARFAGIGPQDPDLIGQAAWYEVVESNAGWQVRVRIGWGDCPAGCINEHVWVYEVTRAGAVALISEEGDPLAEETGIRGVVTAGPTCPVVTDPPDPSCADQPVAGAVLVILDADGVEVVRIRSADDGSFAVALAPGAYRVVPQSVEGLMGTAGELEVQVGVGEPSDEMAVVYDTGIR